jgi:hypothetical protein
MLSLISCSPSHSKSKRARLPDLLLPVARREQESRIALTIPRISREQQSRQSKTLYIDIDDVPLQHIVFNFIEYLSSTLCTNLHPSYLALNYSLYLSTLVHPLVLRL